MLRGIILSCLIVIAQYSVAQIQSIADKVLMLKGEEGVSASERQELDTLWQALKAYRTFQQKETQLNGRAKFGFTGNESDLNNIFKINAGVDIDQGSYPFELDLSSSFQTVIRNGEFAENVSDIDISFDYHPQVGNGLWLENYAYLKRFNNTYLGIDQRYEAGAGLIFNLYSTGQLTPRGSENAQSLATLPSYKVMEDNLWKCYDNVCQRI